jgi:hypothetical protein
MVRIAKDIDYERLEELKKKINDDTYIELAVQTIAQELTKKFVKKED